MNFYGDGIDEYDELVVAINGINFSRRQPKKRDLDLKNRGTPHAKPSIYEPLKSEFKPFPSHLRYVFLGQNSTLSVIIVADLNEGQVGALTSLMLDRKPSIEHQRRLNAPMQEVVKKEIIKWLDVVVIYPIADSSWVCLVQCIPKKGGIIVVPNVKNELVPMRPVIGWRISIAPENDEKTTFTCPYETFAFRRMSFGLCNSPMTFQGCMISIFSYMVEDTIEVFMDDFSVVGDSFDDCLVYLGEVLKLCEECNLVLNWEKCQFMMKEGIVLGHRISRKGIEVDRAKVEVIEKLPPSISVKGVGSFLRHAVYYRRFIKDFSKIAHPLYKLLKKNQSLSLIMLV
ncbi:uncharacterized protein LOC125856073 [Solanum stenotomum]|uniref:uncharacterized protein LOC125856073 n=1 Tax=Solanum stenotomum TaxID=172797 RepID=UPI0020D0CE75|nr:uncharacterized protein LOC125856073 [Solanum stenotomum]